MRFPLLTKLCEATAQTSQTEMLQVAVLHSPRPSVHGPSTQVRPDPSGGRQENPRVWLPLDRGRVAW